MRNRSRKLKNRFWKSRLTTLAVLLMLIPCVGVAYYYWPVDHIDPDAQITKVIVRKSERRLEVFSGETIIATYSVSVGARSEGDKRCRGDNRTPEGTYVLNWRNPQSVAYKSFHISYPNSEDHTEAAKQGCTPGGNIMVHGLPKNRSHLGRFHRFTYRTRGCIAVSNKVMDQLWNVVPIGTPIEIRP